MIIINGIKELQITLCTGVQGAVRKRYYVLQDQMAQVMITEKDWDERNI